VHNKFYDSIYDGGGHKQQTLRHEDNGGNDGRRHDGADSSDNNDFSGTGNGGGNGCGSLEEGGSAGMTRVLALPAPLLLLRVVLTKVVLMNA
jgi:hypothetical protein